MSTPNINALLSASLYSYDNQVTNTPLLSRFDAGNPTLGATAAFYSEYVLASTLGTTLTLPTSPCYLYWVRNRSTLASPIFMFVTATFAVISSPAQCFLGPGDLSIWCGASKQGGQLLGLAVTGISVNCPCEVFIAG